MCLLAYLPRGKVMTQEEVMNAHRSNDDGMGIAYEVGGRWVVEKGITDPQELYRKIEDLKDHRKIVHFRAASAGGIDPDLTHPFETRKFVVAQNGTLSGWSDMSKTLMLLNPVRAKWLEYNIAFNYNPEKLSDTKLIAFILYLAEEGAVDMNKVLEIINKAGKVVLVVKDINTILWFGDRREDDGRIFSNESYRTVRVSRSHQEPVCTIQTLPIYEDARIYNSIGFFRRNDDEIVI